MKIIRLLLACLGLFAGSLSARAQTTAVNPFIVIACDPNQYVDTGLCGTAQASLQFHMDSYAWFGDITLTWPTANVQGTNKKGWVNYVTLASQTTNILALINGGSYDSYFTATATASIGQNIVWRFFHEMNIGGTTWGNQTPSVFIAAWQRIHGLFRAAGNNQPFLWTPNGTWNSGATAFSPYYPGDAYVDMVGIDSYRNQNRPYDSFQTQFQGDLATLATLCPTKPVLISETGAYNSNYISGRAQWVTAMFSYLITQPQIVGWFWWDRPGAGNGPSYAFTGDPLTIGAISAGVQRWKAARVAQIP